MESPTPASHPRSKLVINVELDDRSVLFPDAKMLSHLTLGVDDDGNIRLDAIFHFNASRSEPHIATLDPDDAREFARAIIESVFQGRTQHLLSDRAKIAVVFNPNGFTIRFGEERALKELFLASPAIVRLAHGLLRMVDQCCAVAPH